MAETGIKMAYTGDVATPRFTPHVMPSGKRYQYSAGATVQADPRDVEILRRLQFEEAPKMDDQQQQNIPDSAFEVETNKDAIEREQQALREMSEGVGPSEDPSAEDTEQQTLTADPNAEQSENQDDRAEDGSDESEAEQSTAADPTPTNRRGRQSRTHNT